MPSRMIKKFLDDNQVKYTTILHSTAYTAQEIAALVHVPGKDLAKTVMVWVNEKMGMAVLSASHRVDLSRLGDVTGEKNIRMASEIEFKGLFPECEVGAMPPFGNLYGMDVYVDPELAREEEILFNAGTHTELIRMSFKDFKKLVKPRIVEFAR